METCNSWEVNVCFSFSWKEIHWGVSLNQLSPQFCQAELRHAQCFEQMNWTLKQTYFCDTIAKGIIINDPFFILVCRYSLCSFTCRKFSSIGHVGTCNEDTESTHLQTHTLRVTMWQSHTNSTERLNLVNTNFLLHTTDSMIFFCCIVLNVNCLNCIYHQTASSPGLTGSLKHSDLCWYF